LKLKNQAAAILHLQRFCEKFGRISGASRRKPGYPLQFLGFGSRSLRDFRFYPLRGWRRTLFSAKFAVRFFVMKNCRQPAPSRIPPRRHYHFGSS
jgi:hypothetical protein